MDARYWILDTGKTGKPTMKTPFDELRAGRLRAFG